MAVPNPGLSPASLPAPYCPHCPHCFEIRVMDALKLNGPQRTTSLAKILNEDRDKVYRCCKRLEKQGRVISYWLSGSKRLFFFPVTGEIVHRGNYTRCQHEIKQLIGLINRHINNRPVLVAVLKKYFNQLCNQQSLSRYCPKIRKFESRIIADVLAGKRKEDIYDLVVLKPFYQNELFWRV